MTTAVDTQRCKQCYTRKPLAKFIGARGDRVRNCDECRARMRAWTSLSVAERRERLVNKPRNGIGYIAILVPHATNRKLGPMPVSMTDKASCPSACPYRNGGCYAEFGFINIHWQRVAELGDSWREFCDSVAALPPGTLWRHNEAGDLPGAGDELDARALSRLVTANRGRRGFTFTHKPMTRQGARTAIADANRRGFTINLSADGLAHADRLAELGIAPVAAVVPTNMPAGTRTPAGRKVVLCPAETHGLTCLDCQLCAHPTRKSIVAFRAHGQAKAIVSDLVTLRRKRAVHAGAA